MHSFQPKKIYYTADALNEVGKKILQRFSDAETEPIKQHNRLPDLSEVGHFKVKSDVLVLGKLKTLTFRENGRSADYIAPSLANGCTGGCTYCYVDRHKQVNPITFFTNTDEIIAAIDKHVYSLVWPKKPLQTDPEYYIYDLGCNSDLSVDATISEAILKVFDFFRQHPRAKGSFATKFVNPGLLSYDPQRKVRIRFSLMPPSVNKAVDIRTDDIEERLLAINQFYEAGYEVHVNFSPVIVYGGKQWRQDYRQLFEQLNEIVKPEVKAQMKCEVIFLTHNRGQHEANLDINPKGEQLLWQPAWQEDKRSHMGGHNIRYRHDLKAEMIKIFRKIHAETIPWCKIRYIF
ncbi:spore photoproduct lyase family protein [Catalinimonas niigatensis]|uniref:spore photoproduct lyase family protein n=1 Tax=Catalinimonas niigatensis TaxID=1397264 RepID=UPI002664F0CE|nr:spore photoproduct lyase family protein [Catalinimonas niigatensis]WPP48237.1 spore photoproduct lyase family protein [Catalinimonas niigatensis]